MSRWPSASADVFSVAGLHPKLPSLVYEGSSKTQKALEEAQLQRCCLLWRPRSLRKSSCGSEMYWCKWCMQIGFEAANMHATELQI